MRRLNWLLWSGLLLSVVAFISYFTVFARFPVTRDVPWVNISLFLASLTLLFAGVRSARRKILPAIVAAIGSGIFVFFLLAVFVGARRLPPSVGAPHVGEKAPDFTLTDSSGRAVSLSQLLSTAPRGVLLVFYRGYW